MSFIPPKGFGVTELDEMDEKTHLNSNENTLIFESEPMHLTCFSESQALLMPQIDLFRSDHPFVPKIVRSSSRLSLDAMATGCIIPAGRCIECSREILSHTHIADHEQVIVQPHLYSLPMLAPCSNLDEFYDQLNESDRKDFLQLIRNLRRKNQQIRCERGDSCEGVSRDRFGCIWTKQDGTDRIHVAMAPGKKIPLHEMDQILTLGEQRPIFRSSIAPAVTLLRDQKLSQSIALHHLTQLSQQTSLNSLLESKRARHSSFEDLEMLVTHQGDLRAVSSGEAMPNVASSSNAQMPTQYVIGDRKRSMADLRVSVQHEADSIAECLNRFSMSEFRLASRNGGAATDLLLVPGRRPVESWQIRSPQQLLATHLPAKDVYHRTSAPMRLIASLQLIQQAQKALIESMNQWTGANQKPQLKRRRIEI